MLYGSTHVATVGVKWLTRTCVVRAWTDASSGQEACTSTMQGGGGTGDIEATVASAGQRSIGFNICRVSTTGSVYNVSARHDSSRLSSSRQGRIMALRGPRPKIFCETPSHISIESSHKPFFRGNKMATFKTILFFFKIFT